MCVELTIFRPGQRPLHIETQGELADALGCDLPIDEHYCFDARDDDCCLCPVDLLALAANLGATLAPPDWDCAAEYADTWGLWLP